MALQYSASVHDGEHNQVCFLSVQPDASAVSVYPYVTVLMV